MLKNNVRKWFKIRKVFYKRYFDAKNWNFRHIVQGVDIQRYTPGRHTVMKKRRRERAHSEVPNGLFHALISSISGGETMSIAVQNGL